jgi:hypothetical protein
MNGDGRTPVTGWDHEYGRLGILRFVDHAEVQFPFFSFKALVTCPQERYHFLS